MLQLLAELCGGACCGCLRKATFQRCLKLLVLQILRSIHVDRPTLLVFPIMAYSVQRKVYSVQCTDVAVLFCNCTIGSQVAG
jgi:hypothetical protein